MTTAPAVRPLRTWSVLDGARRKPNEYETVTGRFHYHFGRQPAPFDLDPDSPINRWYLRYREGSPLRGVDWEAFRDPAQLNYRRYIALQHDREIYAEGVVDHFEALDADAGLNPAWVGLLGRLYLPARYLFHVLQITSLYVGQLGPSAYVTNAAFFQAADELRALQWVAYRAKALSLVHGADLADSKITRRFWEDDPAWQPVRETLERLLLAYDWAEAFTVLNLVVKPALDTLLKTAFADLADANGDGLTAQLLRESGVDSSRSQAWSAAVARHAIAQQPDNILVIAAWEDTWRPRTEKTVAGLAALFTDAPNPATPAEVAATVAATTAAFRASWSGEAEPA
ncbi:aromatic/alkene monooxygenase hydroxylase subunit beta [Protofrankia symbiont of Coriaria ruscifolia]|uniref:propane 2-monooxygenase n=1 Tax=Candidatus Protofrankia californiensis TaxID=1839754 RepID=A0A1C3NYB8_9ACTN|nr:aromatic/alkene monooxygenase hydroxylase subunit beta [Protofrankia symbiont of Coriaria ruscifolia]SBW22537.1 methane/phenol/toluene hydroxylase [Candidatus Protofrankia californiensis]